MGQSLTKRRDSSDGSINVSVYNRLKAQILANRLRPGVKLTHEGMAEQFGVSRTPIREALERLAQEGYVHRIPRRGFFVAEIGVDDTRDLYETREALEIFSFEKFLRRGITPQELSTIRKINDQYGTLIEQDLTYERLSIDSQFHVTIVEMAGNSYMARSLQSIFEKVTLKRRVEGMSDTEAPLRFQEHLSLLDAIEKGDVAAGTAILRAHIRSAHERLLQHLRRLG